MSDINLTQLIVNHLTRDELHNADFTDHGNELFVQKDHAGVSVGGVGVDALDTTNITNCITEIPQDIKLELSTDSSGVSNLIVKAGSKLYYPNGSGVFDEVVLTADRVYTDTTKTGQWFVCLTRNFAGVSGAVANSVSGTTKPAADFSLWYNTEENIMYRYGSITSDPTSNISLPIAIVTLGNTGVASIDKVFNGFGYIGSTIFALPGVKGLTPNERTADGTLKNTAWETSQVFTRTFTGNANFYVFCNGTAFPLLEISAYEYKEQENINWNNAEQQKYAATLLGVLKAQSGGKITSFETKTAFHAVDYNDTEFIAHQAGASNRYTDWTLPASGSAIAAPADGYISFVKAAQATEYISLINYTNGMSTTSSPSVNGNNARLFMRVSKGDVINLSYNASGTTVYFRFIYANGAK